MLDEGRLLGPEHRVSGPVERVLYLKRLPVLTMLTGAQLGLVADQMGERFFAKGSTLLREGEAPGALYFPIEGPRPPHQPRPRARPRRARPGRGPVPRARARRARPGRGGGDGHAGPGAQRGHDHRHLRGQLRDPPSRHSGGVAPDRRARGEGAGGRLLPVGPRRGAAAAAARAGPHRADLLPAEVARVHPAQHQRPGPARARAHRGPHAGGHDDLARRRGHRAGAR